MTSKKPQTKSLVQAGPAVAGDMKPIQFRVPSSIFEAFSEQAGREFGFSKGSKSQLFLKLWEDYQARQSKA